MNDVKLNLARKWRSRDFVEIVGQDLSIRMLKNSLYLQQFFPVYLFSGQRGCGKTTAARVFAAALNCEQLSSFQKNPQKISVPCLSCASCRAMEAGKHPDFIEIDAASHTGVDNVRYLIDSASLLPLMGRKKIYLIDEAHMLSKAAFNAFLKIMEEPPASVLFILATTDPQKIIDTVRSRCFQLFFNPVESSILCDRLKKICDAERIAYQEAGLAMSVKQTEGSVRDAINLLEQVRFANSTVTRDAVLKVLGYLDDATLIQLFERTLLSSPPALLQFVRTLNWGHYNAMAIWSRLIELVRAVLWVKYDVEPQQFMENLDALRRVATCCTAKQLHAVLDTMCQYESLFEKTAAKHDILEMMLLHICYHYGTDTEGGMSPSSAHAPAALPAQADADSDDFDDSDDAENEDDEDEAEDDMAAQWKRFVADLSQLNDPLVSSVFSQGVPALFDSKARRLDVVFSKEFVFFKDWLEESAQLWRPFFDKVFGVDVVVNPLFTADVVRVKPVMAATVSEPVATAPAPRPTYERPRVQSAPAQQPYKKQFTKRAAGLINPFHSERALDISDTSTWKNAHIILRLIPGTITEIRE